MNIESPLVKEYWELANKPLRTFEEWARFNELQAIIERYAQ